MRKLQHLITAVHDTGWTWDKFYYTITVDITQIGDFDKEGNDNGI